MKTKEPSIRFREEVLEKHDAAFQVNEKRMNHPLTYQDMCDKWKEAPWSDEMGEEVMASSWYKK